MRPGLGQTFPWLHRPGLLSNTIPTSTQHNSAWGIEDTLGPGLLRFTYALLTNEHAQPHDRVRGPKGKSSCIHLMMGSYPRRHDAHLQLRTTPSINWQLILLVLQVVYTTRDSGTA